MNNDLNGTDYNNEQIIINSVTNKKKNYTWHIILILLLFLTGAYIYLKYYSDSSLLRDIDNKYNNKPFVRDTTCLKEADAQEYQEKNLAILTSKEIDNFSKLDFRNKLDISAYNNSFNFSVIDDKIEFKTDECLDKTFTSEKIENIKSIGVTCHCGGCNALYYLTTDKKLYSLELDHGCMYLDEDTGKLPIKLLAEDATNIAIIDSSEYEPTTCGGDDIIYKSTDGNNYIIYGGDEVIKYNINNYQNKIVYSQYDMGLGLAVINKNNMTEVWNDDSVIYVKDENGNKLYAKNVFYGYQESCLENYTEQDLVSVLFVITENNKIYFLPRGNFYNDSKAYLFSNKTVKSVEDISTEELYKVKVSYSDNTFEEIKTDNVLSDYKF